MRIRYILTDYVNQLMAKAVYDKLEDWILVGLKLGHPLPVIAKINLNRKLGFEGPYSGTRHQFMIREIEDIIGRVVTADEWHKL